MAGLSLCLFLGLLLVVGLVTWVVLDDDPYVAPPPRGSPPSVDPNLAAQALLDLEEAVTEGDVAAAEKLAAAGDDDARELLGTVVENARALRVRDFTLRYVDQTGAVSDDGEWAAAVDTTWRYAGFDSAPARSEVQIGFVAGDDEVALTGVGGGDRRSPVWLSGPVDVRRTAQTLVIGAGPARQTASLAREATTAVRVVRRVLSHWRARLVVEVPGSAQALHRALDADPGTYSAIAAVTTTVDGSLAPDAPIHVFVNPEVYGGLQPQGAQVVMSHEAAHVATGAATSSVPLWLLEGFADYVALRDVDLPLSTTAGQIIQRVRRSGPPEGLPGPAEFDTAAPHLGAVYESAWLACRVLVDLGSEDSLVQLYRRVDDEADLGPALRATFGITLTELTRRWRQRLSDLAQ